jgi:cysteine-rich repeat protein
MRMRLLLCLLGGLLVAPYGAHAFCGDGIVDGAEQCDTAGPSASCDYDCTFVSCGDGVPNPFAGEQCDTAGASSYCNANCTVARCGDGITNGQAGEACDAGGVSTAACDADCSVPVCGDGVLNLAAGEQCDDGNVFPNDGCSPTCQYTACQAQAPAFPWWAAISAAVLLMGTAAGMRWRRDSTT